MRKVTKKWTQKDGTKIRICDMKDSHLLNSIKMLNRMVETERATLWYPCFQGEMAQFYAEQEYENFMSDDECAYPEIYWDLINDADRRGLKYDN